MQKILTARAAAGGAKACAAAAPEAAPEAEACAIGIGPCTAPPHGSPEQAQRLRWHLADFVQRAGNGSLIVHTPAPAGDEPARGSGHFHLAPELFLQVAGWTLFSFPHGGQRLLPGQALLLPPRLRHAELVGASVSGEAFSNLVIYAEDAALSCHLAHESAPGLPGILHLEASRGPQAARIQDWLGDAARIARDHGPAQAIDATGAPPWAALQVRALLTAASAGVLQALDAADAAAPPEPALVARVRVLIQNQLGDPALSVRRLAEQSGCSADYLSHLFGRCTGEHLVAHIARLRMERAARLLGESRMAGKEIAWACGFATPSYFIRSFRGHFGITPKAWRSQRGLAPLAGA